MAIERWLPVVGYEGLYEVSNRGRVLGVRRQSLMKLQPHRGYLKVNLSKDGVQKQHRVHRLVLEAFAGECPEGMEACHGPGGGADNRWPENLRWDTKRENEVDKRGPDAPPSTHCPSGHEFTELNTYEAVRPDGHRERHCRTCRRERWREKHGKGLRVNKSRYQG